MKVGQVISLALLCLLGAQRLNAQEQPNLVQYVNPMIGTQRMGHTFPGATVPFGAVQLSPDTDTIPYSKSGRYNPDVYKYCAGYQYNDPTIVGFSHTHFSGTGHADLGDFLIMPTQGNLQMNPGTVDHPESGFRSRFNHAEEHAEANYYKVLLRDHHILAELTTTNRTGMHRYTFKDAGPAHIILDMMSGIYNYDQKNIWTFLRVENDSTVVGYRQTNGWARTRTVYFAMKFSKAFKSYGMKDFSNNNTYKGFWRKFNQTENFPDIAGTQMRLHFDFDLQPEEQVLVKLALSPVSTKNAMENLVLENPFWNFDAIKKAGQELWNRELNKIKIQAQSREDMINFYTSMYHATLMPSLYMDVNGEYKGLDQNVHLAKGFTNYTSFSLWDTFRALHPYLNLINPQRNSDMVRSMLAHYDQSALKMLPVWSHYANDNWCMSGYHSVSVIADAIIKGVYKGDSAQALAACVATAEHRNYEGIGEYMDKGYVSAESSGVSVSNTLEYAYDDWCIAQLAKKLNKQELYERFIKRSRNWQNVYDSRIGYMRPRLRDGAFKKSFDVLKTDGQGFIEGNAWNFSLYVPHQPEALIELMGGKKKFAIHLDSLFTMHLPDEFFAETEDITRDGIIGNYVHGNEPSHHVAYLYNFTDQPWKTQERVRMILKKQYHTGPGGLGGNDDCGQMSAWYIFSALGFYPISPGSLNYEIGSPAILSADISLGDRKRLKIHVNNQGEKNVYVKSIFFNGLPIIDHSISHNRLMQGGDLIFNMSSKPTLLKKKK